MRVEKTYCGELVELREMYKAMGRQTDEVKGEVGNRLIPEMEESWNEGRRESGTKKERKEMGEGEGKQGSERPVNVNRGEEGRGRTKGRGRTTYANGLERWREGKDEC